MCGIGAVLLSEDDADADGNSAVAAELQRVLAPRGPDAAGTVSKAGGGVVLVASVLHIRGDAATPQPHVDGSGNVLCWNGEAFGHAGTPVDGSDTVWVARLLQTAADAADADGCDPVMRCGQHLAAALADVVGPYAFVFYCERLSAVFYGRDPFGRRSLLVAQASSRHGGVRAVASVRPPRNVWEWAEVPAMGIYAVPVTSTSSTRSAQLIPWPTSRLRLARQPLPPVPLVVTLTRPRLPPALLTGGDNVDREPWQRLFLALFDAVHLRVRAMGHVAAPTPPSAAADTRPARFGVLFSGGIDSVVLAALLHLSLDDAAEPVDLINVCFSDGPVDPAQTPPQLTEPPTHLHGHEPPAPDRLAAIAALLELRQQYPTRPFRLVHVDVPAADRHDLEAHVMPLVYPCNTLMDLNIGMALSAAARAEHGYVKDYSEDDAAMARTAQDPAGRPLVRLGALDAARSVGLGQWRQRGGGDDGGATTRTNDGSKADGVVCGNAPRCRLVAKRGCIRGFCRRCCNAAENTATGPSGGFCSIHPSRAALAATAAASAARAVDDGAHHARPPPVPVGSARVPHVTACKALFIGIGADEQCAGYSRHRTAWLRGGAAALEAELDMDCARLPTRNLGRDDRCVADAAREPWFPYLDEGVVRLLASLPVSDLCDLHLPPGEGDKKILRQLAAALGLPQTATLVKRAIQFGSKVAKVTNVAKCGSSRNASGDFHLINATASEIFYF